MRTIQLHSLSLLVGALVAVCVAVTMAPTPPMPSTQTISNGLVPAHSMVQIKEGTPYVVPASKVLVITGVGSTFIGGNYGCTLSVNGVQEIMTVAPQNLGSGELRSVVSVPIGFAIPAGSVVTVYDSYLGQGRVWGYLERI